MVIVVMHNRVGGLAIGAVLAVLIAGCSSDDKTSSTGSVQYLGLGDSIAYGENGFVPYTAEARPNGDAFVGYPDLLGREVFAGHYANLGCPGATTNSFSSLDGEDNGCRDFQAKWLNTLHVPYTTTEADKAEEILGMNDVHAITISIGGNDLLVTLSGCTTMTPDDPSATFACALKELPTTINTGVSNLGAMLKRIRDGGFKGELVYVNLYSTYLSTDSATIAVNAWNSAMAPVVADAGGQVADAFTAFANAAAGSGGDPCAAGLLVPNPVTDATPACDVHPSQMGTRLLADTVKATPGFGP
jgi:hypothetical protein